MSHSHHVLAFDADCLTCSEIAERVERQVGDKLSVMSLRDQKVLDARHNLLGADAPWVPTLIDFNDHRPRAWTGVGLAWTLYRILGPTDSLHVLKSIGSYQDEQKARSADKSDGINRARFLKASAVGGAAAFAALISPGLAGKAFGGTGRGALQFNSLNIEEITGPSLDTVVHDIQGRPEVLDMMRQGNFRTPLPQAPEGIRSARHKLEDGNYSQVTVFPLTIGSDNVTVLMFTEFDRPWGPDQVLSEARQWQLRPQGNLTLEKISTNSGPVFDVDELRRKSRVAGDDPCGGCGGIGWYYHAVEGCGGINLGACAQCAACVAACASSAVPALVGCAACLVNCGGKIEQCCTQGKEICRPCSGPLP